MFQAFDEVCFSTTSGLPYEQQTRQVCAGLLLAIIMENHSIQFLLYPQPIAFNLTSIPY